MGEAKAEQRGNGSTRTRKEQRRSNKEIKQGQLAAVDLVPISRWPISTVETSSGPVPVNWSRFTPSPFCGGLRHGLNDQ